MVVPGMMSILLQLFGLSPERILSVLAAITDASAAKAKTTEVMDVALIFNHRCGDAIAAESPLEGSRRETARVVRLPRVW